MNNNSSDILESSQTSSTGQLQKSLNELDLELQKYWYMMASSWGMEEEIPADWWKYFSHNINIREFQKYFGFQGTNGLTSEQAQQRLQFEEMKVDQELKKNKLDKKVRYRERWLFLLLIVYKFAVLMAALLFFVVFWYERECYPVLIAGLFLLASFIFFCSSEQIPEGGRKNLQETQQIICLFCSLSVFFFYYLIFSIPYFPSINSDRSGLMKLIPTECLVIRDGIQMTIKSTELVQGDVLQLTKGVQVAADCRVLNFYQEKQQRTLIINSPYLFKERRSDMQCTDPLSQLISMNVIPQGSIIVGGLGQAVALHSVANSRLYVLAQNQQRLAELKYYHRDYSKNFMIRLYYYLTIVATIGLFLSIAFALIQKYVRSHTDIQTLYITAVTIVAFLPTGLLTACEMGIKYFFPRRGFENQSNQYCFSFDARLSTLFLLQDGLTKGIPWNDQLEGDALPSEQKNGKGFDGSDESFSVNGLEQNHVTLLADVSYLISDETILKTLWISQLEVEMDTKLGWVGMNVLNGTDQTLQHLYSCFIATQGESTQVQDKEISKFFNNLPNKVHFNRLSSIIARNENGNCVSIQEDWLRLDCTLQIVQERSEEGDFVVYVRGNPRKIWSACTSIYKNGKSFQITKQIEKRFERIMKNVAAKAENGIAFAKKVLRESYNGNFIDERGRLQIPLCGFCFISLATFSIDVHPEAHDALELVAQSGMNLILFTTQERAVTEQLAIKLGLALKQSQFSQEKEVEGRDGRVDFRQQEELEDNFLEDRMDIASEVSSLHENEINEQGFVSIQEAQRNVSQSQSNTKQIYELNEDEIEYDNNDFEGKAEKRRNTKQLENMHLSNNFESKSQNKENKKPRRNFKLFDDSNCVQDYPKNKDKDKNNNYRNCMVRTSILDELAPFKAAALNIDADNCTEKQINRYRSQSTQQSYLKLKKRQIACDLKIHQTSPHIELICNADLSSRQCMVNQLNKQGIKSWYLAGNLCEFQAFNSASVILAAPYSNAQDTQNLNGLLSAADARLTTDHHSTMIHSAVYLIHMVNSLSSRLRQAFYFVSVTHTASFIPLLLNICFSIPLMISPLLMLLMSSLVNVAPVLAIFKFKHTQPESFRISTVNRKVIHARLIHYSVFVMGVIATAAGLLSFVFSMNRFGFPMWSLPYLADQQIFLATLASRQLQNNQTDFIPRFLASNNTKADTVITPSMPYWNRQIMTRGNNCKNDLDIFKPIKAKIDWYNFTNTELDLRPQFVYCDQQTNEWKTSIEWSPCQLPDFTNSEKPICYTTAALAYSQTSYFLGLFFFQFLHMFAANSLSYSMFLSRFNAFNLLALLVSFIIALMIVQIPGVQLILGTRSVQFWLWGIPGMVVAVFASIHEEIRKLLMTKSKWFRRVCIK